MVYFFIFYRFLCIFTFCDKSGYVVDQSRFLSFFIVFYQPHQLARGNVKCIGNLKEGFKSRSAYASLYCAEMCPADICKTADYLLRLSFLLSVLLNHLANNYCV